MVALKNYFQESVACATGVAGVENITYAESVATGVPNVTGVKRVASVTGAESVASVTGEQI